jgi:hypothetical protein
MAFVKYIICNKSNKALLKSSLILIEQYISRKEIEALTEAYITCIRLLYISYNNTLVMHLNHASKYYL